MPDVVLQVPDRFQLLRPLGEGGMGVVYEALDRERNARVALKTLKRLSSRKAGANALLRFKREFRALQDLHHRNLVTLGELIGEGQQWFFTMELVEGPDFLAYVRPRAPIAEGGVFALEAADEAASAAGGSVEDAPVQFKRVGARPDPSATRLDEARLRATLPQLASGLAALHAAGKVHRDIKPSNIRVAHGGRVVLLDFGLVAEVSERSSIDGDITGTPAYMAPEQATAEAVGPAADWYALGVVLYEALTGQLPFDGTPLDILVRKQDALPPPPRDLAPGIPADLADLCMRLLRPAPAERPTDDEVIAQLAARPVAPSFPSLATTATRGAPFVGRAKELEALVRAFNEARETSAQAVVVDGESGVGKTCLVRQFLDRLVEAYPEAVVLAGRCYEREQVPYKGLDGVIDELARHLAALSDDQAFALVPDEGSGPLVQIFPVLRRSRAFAFVMTEEPGDPRELRRRAFAALRSLLAAVAARAPLIIAVDDMQWADADTLSLVSEVLRGADAPPLLLVATVRDVQIDDGTAAIAAAVPAVDVAAHLTCPVHEIHLDRLPDEDAHALATTLLESIAPHRAQHAGAIAREAQGHPLFIAELARHAALVAEREIAGAGPDDTALLVRPTFDLDEAIATRVARLDRAARETLEIVAIAGRPLAQETVAQAVRMEMGAFARVVAQLRASHLVLTRGARASDRIEPYHERVRAAVVGFLSSSERSACHKRLAIALEASRSPDGDALSIHWARGGNPARAARYAVAAAHQATEALAFDRAAACWERALQLTPDGDPKQRVLRVRMGEALANAGRGARAAKAFAAAADGAPAAEGLDLRRRAAEQFLRSGRFDEGISAARVVLASLGLEYPRSPLHALVTLLVLRVLLALHGVRYRERDPSQIPARDLARIDVCWSVAFALALSDHIYGAVFQARAMLFALRAGEPTRVARALAVGAGYLATGGGRAAARVERHLAHARAIGERTRDAQSIAYAVANSAIAHYLAGDFRRALEDADRGEAIFRERIPGSAWERATLHHFALIALLHLGELRELCRRQPVYLRDALDRGDTYASACMRLGYASYAWLVRGDADAARRDAHEAMQAWSNVGCHLEHFYELVALVDADLYQGRAEEALARVEARWGPMRRALLLRIEMVRLRCLELRARCALKVAARRGVGWSALVARAERDARAIRRQRAPWATPMADALLASAAALRGRGARAAARLRDAIAGFDAAGMALHAAAARWRLADVVGGDDGAAARERAAAWLREQGVADVDALVGVVAP